MRDNRLSTSKPPRKPCPSRTRHSVPCSTSKHNAQLALATALEPLQKRQVNGLIRRANADPFDRQDIQLGIICAASLSHVRDQALDLILATQRLILRRRRNVRQDF